MISVLLGAFVLSTGVGYILTRALSVPIGKLTSLMSDMSAGQLKIQIPYTDQEDYVHSEGTKIVLLMLNTFFAITVGLASAYAILKIGFAG